MLLDEALLARHCTTLFEHMGNQGGNPEKADSPALGAGGKAQGGGQVRLTGAGVTEKEHVFVLIDIFPAHEFTHERLVDRGLRFESEALRSCLNERRESGVVEPVSGAGRGDRRPLAQDGGQFELLEMML